MSSRHFKPQIHRSLTEAIHATATRSGVPQKEIADALGYSASNLSQRVSLAENPQYPFPADERLIKIQEVTGVHDILATMADRLGYELRPKADRLDAVIQEIAERQEELYLAVRALVVSAANGGVKP